MLEIVCHTKTLPNFIKTKHPSKQGRGKKNKSNDQSPSKQTTQKRQEGHKEEMEPLRMELSISHMKHIN
jgi:hypothetical protein